MNRNIQTIFCDDIRHEIEGKISYIGVYNGTLFLPEFPATLPKLCLSVTAFTSPKQPFLKLKLRVLHDDTEIFTGELDENQLSEITGDTLTNTFDDAWLSLHSFVVFSPFSIEIPGKIRVIVETEEGDLLGQCLKIEAIHSNS